MIRVTFGDEELVIVIGATSIAVLDEQILPLNASIPKEYRDRFREHCVSFLSTLLFLSLFQRWSTVGVDCDEVALHGPHMNSFISPQVRRR